MTHAEPVIQAIRARRSVRKFRPEPVSREQLETIVDCGRLAPSAMNRQTWEFVVVTTQASLERISELAPNNGPFIRSAGACIVICGDRDFHSVFLDGSAAAENMLLAAEALGLGACWVQAWGSSYSPAIRELLAIPADKVLVALLPVGVPAGPAASPAKRPLDEVLHWERY